MNHIYHLLLRLVATSESELRADHVHTSHGVLICRKGSYNDEEPQCMRIETATCQTDTLHARTHRVPPHAIWRSTVHVHTENDRFRSHGQILPTLRQLHPQNSKSRIRQSIFLAGEITSIQKKFFSNLTLIDINILNIPLIPGLGEA